MTALDRIIAGAFDELETWLDSPSDTHKELIALRERLQALGPAISTRAKRDALKALEGSENDIRRARAREAADALCAALRPLGIVLTAGPVPKRIRKRRRVARSTPPSPVSTSKAGDNVAVGSFGRDTSDVPF